MKEEKKIYTYRFNRGTKEWEKFSMKTLCIPSDKLKKERETIIKDFIDIYGLPHTVLRPDLTKAKYQVIMLYPSKLLIVMGTGLSVAMLNDTKIADIEKQATKIDITHEMIEGFAKRKGAWIMYAERILNDSKKCK